MSMKNHKDMVAELATLYDNVKNGHTKAFDAKEMTNICGKMIGASKLKLEYVCMQQQIADLKIDFLED